MFNIGRRLRRVLGATAAAGMALAVASTPATATATATTSSSAALCQSSYLVYKYWKSDNTIGTWRKNCSGDYPLNSLGYKLEPGGWSGYIDYSDGSWDYFCDFRNKWLSKRVVKITMSPAKIEYCFS
ncbi:hypothetical protein AB0C18_43015 [Nonomuraea muscovyensis]|uniref:hypothetical protein n=1 Tax=Nonomuraea muscovyensis TaxID=1124761 RepID=UPI0033FC72FA